MRVVVEISLDSKKVEELKKRLDAIVSTTNGSAPQVNKNRRIKSLVSIAQGLIDEMVTTRIVTKCREVANG